LKPWVLHFTFESAHEKNASRLNLLYMPASILIVEDQPQFSQPLAKALLDVGDLRLAGVAEDISEGRRLLDEQQPDVMLVDLGLPGGSGIELIHYASQRLPQCESMVITIFGDDESIVRCIQAGATGYLLKDASVMHIVEQIHLLLDGGSPISPSVARRLLKRIGGRPEVQALSTPSDALLSPQELSVLALSAKGYNYMEISDMLSLSRHTIQTYVKRVYRKLQVHTKTEAVYEARKLGLLGD
jgi:DNA-binding NarL/FixJ family response regulator